MRPVEQILSLEEFEESLKELSEAINKHLGEFAASVDVAKEHWQKAFVSGVIHFPVYPTPDPLAEGIKERFNERIGEMWREHRRKIKGIKRQ